MAEQVELEVVDPGSTWARRAMHEYFLELDGRLSAGFDMASALAASITSYRPPDGLFVVAVRDGEVVGCGGISWLDDERGEIKRMWVDASTRGMGLGRRLLTRLEEEVAASGRNVVVLDTNAVLVEAIAMYRRAGYVEVERYNDNADADLWFAKQLR